jgi:hypothetical protein
MTGFDRWRSTSSIGGPAACANGWIDPDHNDVTEAAERMVTALHVDFVKAFLRDSHHGGG